MSPTTWANNNLGRTHLNPDPPHGIDGQCVNAASSWLLSIGGPELIGATAWSIWQSFRHPFFTAINYAPGTGPQAGDVVFFKPNVSSLGTGPAGHVDICINPYSAASFKGADADWGQLPLQYVEHRLNSNEVAGWFRPGGNVTPVDELNLQHQILDFNSRKILETLIFTPGNAPSIKNPNYGIGMLAMDYITAVLQLGGKYSDLPEDVRDQLSKDE